MKSILLVVTLFLTPIFSIANSDSAFNQAENALDHLNVAIEDLSGTSQNFQSSKQHTKTAKRILTKLITSEFDQEFKELLISAVQYAQLSLNFIELYDVVGALQNLNGAARTTNEYVQATAGRGHCCTRPNCKGCTLGQTDEASCRALAPQYKSFRYTDGTCVNF